jgi:Isochorismatase family
MHVAGTDPYPWPYDGRLVGPHLAVLLAGWDLSWAGRCPTPGSALVSAEALARAVVEAGGAVLTVAHLGSSSLPLSAPRVDASAHGVDGFHGGPLDDLLRAGGHTHLLVAGMGLEGPVHSTLRSANDRGYECLLVSDATASLGDDLAHAATRTVTMSGGIFGAVGTAAATISALAGGPSPTTATGARA